MNLKDAVIGQRRYFSTGATKRYETRAGALKRLKNSITRHGDELTAALGKDLGRSTFEGYMTEVGNTKNSIDHTLKALPGWMKDETVKRTLTNPFSRGVIKREPLGTVLIMVPFNYPILLLFEPLMAAVSAGNTVICKSSSLTPHVNEVIGKIIKESFREDHVYYVDLQNTSNEEVLEETYDLIFFTGGTATARTILAKAAPNLTPVILELGGKSPAIVMKNSEVAIAARKIIWGKMLNAGQTCIAPDYVLVHEDVADHLIREMKQAIADFFGMDPHTSPDFGRIISQEAFERLLGLIKDTQGTIVSGGNWNKAEKYIEPMLVRDVLPEDPLMEREIFGPILPIITYRDINQAIEQIKPRGKPLALYVFSRDIPMAKAVMGRIPFGGGCINDTMIHVSNPNLPLGGVGMSGMGKYHGRFGFDSFSHQKGLIVTQASREIPFIYPPYNKTKLKLVKRILG